MSKKVLIIEDDEDIARNLTELLESENYRVQVALNGKLALELLRSSNDLPSLIILDLMMPVMDGFEFRRHQKADLRFADIPVVVMTANCQVETKKMEIGEKAFIRKPFRVETVLDIVDRFAA